MNIKLDQEGIQAINGCIFVFITENTFPIMYGVLETFPKEFPVFLREVQNGLYGVDSYYLAKILSLVRPKTPLHAISKFMTHISGYLL